MIRTDPPTTGDERAVLLGFVQFLRETILVECEGLGDDALRTAHPPSTMTLGGMLAHLDFVEDYWIGHVLLGGEPEEPWRSAPWDDDPDWDWHCAAQRGGDELRTALRRRWATSDAVIAGLGLDAPTAQPVGDAPGTLRWILLHFVEEYGRHAGHADMLREAIDGETGE